VGGCYRAKNERRKVDMVEANKSVFKYIAMDKIDRPSEATRLEIDAEEIRELAESIEERGLLQPILVAPRGNRFEIVAGDRRYLAHVKLGRKKIQAKVSDSDDVSIIIDRATENLQRRDLTPLEEGVIYAGLRDKMGLTVGEISQKIRKSAGRIERRLSVLKMPDSFQKALHFGKVSMTVAEELWSTPDADKREYFLELAVHHGITKDIARSWVDDFKASLRQKLGAGEGGSRLTEPFENVPIYRACDLCKDPVEYKDVVELRVCPRCGKGIIEGLKKAME